MAFAPETGKIVWRGDAVLRQIDQATLSAARRTVAAMKARAQSLARVKTGRMRAGVEGEVSNVAGGRVTMTLSDRVPYAAIYAGEFLEPGFQEGAAKFPGFLRDEIGRIQ